MCKNVNLLVFVSEHGDEAQAGFQCAGEASAARCKASWTRSVEVRSSSTTGCGTADRGGVGAAIGRGRQGSAQARRTGTASAIGDQPRTRTGQDTDGRGFGGWISDGAMDIATRGQVDHGTFRRRIQYRPPVAPSAPLGILLPKAGEARHPARRSRDSAMEATHLACAQKKPSAKAEPSSSSTNPD